MTFNKTTTLHCTCDDVFDTLTRGPFPTGDACIDQPTERHLQCCHECRTLAEAFRPATEVLEESLPAEMSSDLPVYQGAFWDQQSTQWETSPAVVTKTKTNQYLKPLTVLAASILVLFCVGYWGNSSSTFSSQIPSSPVGTSETQKLAEQRLLSLPLSLACVTSGKQSNLELPSSTVQFVSTTRQLAHAGNLSDLQCCSQCHNATLEQPGHAFNVASATVAPASLLAIVSSCQACHAH
ncbi:MAG: hypothetical protein COA78_08780 [Blastopirellula sp.]|nr:MAG: hypothetical protein COA78_08780 [Blastopirellula sp.]